MSLVSSDADFQNSVRENTRYSDSTRNAVSSKGALMFF